MSPDQITAIGAAVVAVVSAVSTATIRWTSKAGRVIRRQRREREAAEEYIYELRTALLRAGVARRDIPRVPGALADFSVASADYDRTDDE